MTFHEASAGRELFCCPNGVAVQVRVALRHALAAPGSSTLELTKTCATGAVHHSTVQHDQMQYI